MIDFIPLFVQGIQKMPWLALVFMGIGLAYFLEAIDTKWDRRCETDEKKAMEEAD